MSLATSQGRINVTNLDRSTQFYERALGLRSMGGSNEHGRRFAFLGNGSKLMLTIWEQSEGRFDGRKAGLHHPLLPGQLDRRRGGRRDTRPAAGAKFLYDGIVAHAGGRDSGGIFFEDPDGTRLEIFAITGAASQPAPSGAAPSCCDA